MYIKPSRVVSVQERKKAIITVSVLAFFITTGLLMFYFFPLGQYDIYPQCPTYAWTNTHCPGCGTLRGVNGLVQGNPMAMVSYNIFGLFALPYLLYGFVIMCIIACTGKKPKTLAFNGKEIMVIFVLVTLYWILRNFIPILAPHAP